MLLFIPPPCRPLVHCSRQETYHPDTTSRKDFLPRYGECGEPPSVSSFMAFIRSRELPQQSHVFSSEIHIRWQEPARGLNTSLMQGICDGSTFSPNLYLLGQRCVKPAPLFDFFLCPSLCYHPSFHRYWPPIKALYWYFKLYLNFCLGKP